MSDEQWLRDALAGAVPEPPATDRLAAVHARRRRTTKRRTAAVCAAAAAVAAAITVPLALAGSGGGPPVAGDPSPSIAPTTAADPGCSPAATSPTGPGSIPAHPTAVRLCAGPEGVPWRPPADLLTTGADRVAEAVDHQPVVEPDPAVPCRADLGRAYRLVFGYADGTTAVAAGELYGCEWLSLGATRRSGARAPWDAFVTLLRAQRRAMAPPPRPDRAVPTCQAAYRLGSSALGAPEEIVAGRLCARLGERWVDVAVGEADLRAIVVDYRQAPAMSNASVMCLDRRRWSIVGTNAWGDLARIESDCGWYTGKGPHGADAARIGPQARQILDRLLEEVTSR